MPNHNVLKCFGEDEATLGKMWCGNHRVIFSPKKDHCAQCNVEFGWN